MAKTYNIYTKFKNKNPLQKHKIKIKNMHNNNRCVLKKTVPMSETTECERHSTQWKPLAFASSFWGTILCDKKTCIEGASPHYKKYAIKKEPGQLVQSIKKCGRMFPLKKKKRVHTWRLLMAKVRLHHKIGNLLQHLSLHTNTLGEGFALKYTHKMFEWRAVDEIERTEAASFHRLPVGRRQTSSQIQTTTARGSDLLSHSRLLHSTQSNSRWLTIPSFCIN